MSEKVQTSQLPLSTITMAVRSSSTDLYTVTSRQLRKIRQAIHAIEEYESGASLDEIACYLLKDSMLNITNIKRLTTKCLEEGLKRGLFLEKSVDGYPSKRFFVHKKRRKLSRSRSRESKFAALSIPTPVCNSKSQLANTRRKTSIICGKGDEKLVGWQTEIPKTSSRLSGRPSSSSSSNDSVKSRSKCSKGKRSSTRVGESSRKRRSSSEGRKLPSSKSLSKSQSQKYTDSQLQCQPSRWTLRGERSRATSVPGRKANGRKPPTKADSKTTKSDVNENKTKITQFKSGVKNMKTKELKTCLKRKRPK